MTPNPALRLMQLRPQYKPGHGPPAAPPPAPPRGKPRHEPEPPAAFRVIAGRALLRHPGAAAIDDLHPDNADAGRHRDGNRFPGKTRAAVPHAVTEQLAREEDSVIPAGVPRTEDRAHERADNSRPFRQPGNFHALANRRPAHQRTAFPPARKGPQGTDGRAGKCTLTSAAIVKPDTSGWRTARQKSAGCA
jgi:hypothetical protein